MSSAARCSPDYVTDGTQTTIVLVRRDGSEVELGRLDAHASDLRLVDALARLALTARRRGASLRVRDPTDELLGLLELVGLAGVLGIDSGREAELGEQLGVEEVVQPGDPSA